MEQPPLKKDPIIAKLRGLEDHFRAILALKELSYGIRKVPYKKTLKDYIFREPEGRYGSITSQGILYELCYPIELTCDVYSAKPYEINHAHELFTPWGHIKLLPLNLDEIKKEFLSSFQTTLIKEEQKKGFIIETYIITEVRGISLPSDTKEIIGYCLNTDEFNLRHQTIWPMFVKKYNTNSKKSHSCIYPEQL